jgi:hypothetical protein
MYRILLVALAALALAPVAFSSDGTIAPARFYCEPDDPTCADVGGTDDSLVNADTSTQQSGTWSDWDESEPGTFATVSCHTQWAEVLTQDPTHWYTSTRSKLVWNWCYLPGVRITKISGLFAYSTQSDWPWNYDGITSGPTAGPTGPGNYSSYVGVQFKYTACIIWKGCFFVIHPWLYVTFDASGHWQVYQGGAVSG